MKTYSAKPSDVTRVWHVLDAQTMPLGRVASQAATLLIGKHKPQFTSHIDTGDFVIIINADELVVTGEKMDKKLYRRHSQYPGGITTTSLRDMVAKDATKVVIKAVRNMLPVNKLRDGRLARLKVYPGNEHPHTAQQPVVFSKKDTK